MELTFVQRDSVTTAGRPKTVAVATAEERDIYVIAQLPDGRCFAMDRHYIYLGDLTSEQVDEIRRLCRVTDTWEAYTGGERPPGVSANTPVDASWLDL